MNLAFGWAAGVSESGDQSFPFQSIRWDGASLLIPSHQTSLSSVRPTLVNIQFLLSIFIAVGFESMLVPGATPKYPASGFIARKVPSFPGLIQAMSSPTVHIFHPLKPFGGTSIAKFVFPQALGKAAATYVFSPSGDSTPKINMCSASQPCCFAITEAILRAKHFFPNRAFPP